jgi:hypothetical protein
VNLEPGVEQALLYGVTVVIILGALVVTVWQLVRFLRRDRD